MCTSDTTISNNSIEFNRDWGISLEDSSSFLTGNTFQGNGLGDIHT
jgi:parallel beta-helix repeat protein